MSVVVKLVTAVNKDNNKYKYISPIFMLHHRHYNLSHYYTKEMFDIFVAVFIGNLTFINLYTNDFLPVSKQNTLRKCDEIM